MEISEILSKYGVSVPEDRLDEFNRDFKTHYKSAAEHKKLKDSLIDHQTKLANAADFEGKYNTLFRKYEADIAAKDAEIAGLNFSAKLDKALSGVNFINDRVRDSVIGEIKSKKFKVSDNGDIEGLAEYLKDLRTNEPDIFKAGSSVNTFVGGSNNKQNNNNNKPTIFGKLL